MSAIGALVGLLLSIFLIVRKVSPFYSLLLGATIGGLVGGFGIAETVAQMISGVKDVSPAIVRILSAGVLTGTLIKSGAAASIAHFMVEKLGNKRVYASLALSCFVLTGIGVFIDVAVITVAPIALNIGKELKISKAPLLLMMIGGGKCGNIISPNPNTIVAAENLQADLSQVMLANAFPALIGLIFVIWVMPLIFPSGDLEVMEDEVSVAEKILPGIGVSLVAPITAILLLAMRPVLDIAIDPLLALPMAGLAGVAATRSWNKLEEGLNYGLMRMSSIAILLVGTGTIAGIIKASSIKDVLLSVLSSMSLDPAVLAPFSGAVMSAASASTTAGATIASATFGSMMLEAGVGAIAAAAMMNAGATVLDHLPHGSFFHATGGVMNFNIKDRLRLIPYESLIGLFLAILSYVFLVLF
ncbi:MAG: GntP family permease [Saprospiraceae bacterium]|nr:GntP family permease [Saprospiraceae bacterium]